jgi:hypothetical protein
LDVYITGDAADLSIDADVSLCVGTACTKLIDVWVIDDISVIDSCPAGILAWLSFLPSNMRMPVLIAAGAVVLGLIVCVTYRICKKKDPKPMAPVAQGTSVILNVASTSSASTQGENQVAVTQALPTAQPVAVPVAVPTASVAGSEDKV